MEDPRKTLTRGAENPRQEKGTSDPEKRREQGQKNTEGHQATGGLPKPQSGTQEEERDRGCSERQEPRKVKRRNGGEKSNKARQGKMPRKGNLQSRRKPHREEKRSTEANDEAHPRKQGASKSTGPGTLAEGTETKS